MKKTIISLVLLFPVWIGMVWIGYTINSAIVHAQVKTTSINRSYLDPDARSWSFLGSSSLAATAGTAGPITWTQSCTEYMFHYWIPGTTSGTGVGRFLVGGASISTTALTNGSAISEGVTSPTSAPSIPGMPLAVTLSNISREGWIFIYGASGALKRIEASGQNGGASVSSPPTLFRGAGVFSDLGTNLPLQQAQLTLYDSLTATTASSTNKLNIGTSIEGWCRNGD